MASTSPPPSSRWQLTPLPAQGPWPDGLVEQAGARPQEVQASPETAGCAQLLCSKPRKLLSRAGRLGGNQGVIGMESRGYSLPTAAAPALPGTGPSSSWVPSGCVAGSKRAHHHDASGPEGGGSRMTPDKDREQPDGSAAPLLAVVTAKLQAAVSADPKNVEAS